MLERLFKTQRSKSPELYRQFKVNVFVIFLSLIFFNFGLSFASVLYFKQPHIILFSFIPLFFHGIIRKLCWYFKKKKSNGDYFKLLSSYYSYRYNVEYKVDRIIRIIKKMKYNELIAKKKFIIKNAKFFNKEDCENIIKTLNLELSHKKVNQEFKTQNRVKNKMIKEI